MIRPLLIFLFAAALLAIPSRAFAQAKGAPRKILVDLQTGGAPPKHVCLVQQLPLSKNRVGISAGKPEQAGDATLQSYLTGGLPAGGAAEFVKANAKTLLKSPYWDEVRAAIQALSPNAFEETQTARGEACNDRHHMCPIEVHYESGKVNQFVFCRSQSAGEGVAFVDVKWQGTGDERAIKAMSLSGPQLSLEVVGTQEPEFYPAGGSFRATTRVAQRSSSGVPTLTLEPACHLRMLDLGARKTDEPGASKGPQQRQQQQQLHAQQQQLLRSATKYRPDVWLTRGGSEPDRICQLGPDNRVWLPVLEAGPKELDVAIYDPAATEQRLTAMFRAEWYDEVSPVDVRLSARGLTFRWLRNCFSPAGRACPNASIDELGLRCTAEDLGSECRYACFPSSGVDPTPAALPLTARFAVGRQADAWTDKITYVGQLVSGYAERNDRQFDVLFADDWAGQAGWRDDPERVRAIEIWSSLGGRGLVALPEKDAHLRKTPELPQRVTLAGVACTDRVSFKVQGSREFGEEFAQFDKGSLVLPRPKTGRVVRVHFGFGGGFLFEDTLRSRDDVTFRARPYAIAQGGVQVRPLRSRWAWEPELSYLFSLRGYDPVDVPLQGHSDADAHVFYNRLLFEPLAASLRIDDVDLLLVGLGAGFGWPVLDVDSAKVGNPDFIFSPARVGIRFNLGKIFSVEARARVMLEQWNSFGQPLPGGLPPRTVDWRPNAGLDIGFRFFP